MLMRNHRAEMIHYLVRSRWSILLVHRYFHHPNPDELLANQTDKGDETRFDVMKVGR